MQKKKPKKPKKRLTQLTEEDRLAATAILLHQALINLENLDEFASERKIIMDIKNKLDNKVLKMLGSIYHV